jgi:predicted DNA-binding protein (UPF0251 family)
MPRGDARVFHLHPELVTRGDAHYSRRRPELVSRGDRHYSRVHPERLVRGETHGHAKLTVNDVQAIRARVASGDTQQSVALAFGVAQPCVSRIVHGRRWAHVTDAVVR